MKRLLSIFILTAFLLSVLPLSVLCADAEAVVLASGYIRIPYKQLLMADDDGSLTAEPEDATEMPRGLSVEKEEGGIYLAGTPEYVSEYTFGVRIGTDPANMQLYRYSLTVKDQPVEVPDAIYGEYYEQLIWSASDALIISDNITPGSSLPSGFELKKTEEGLYLKGTPKRVGRFHFQVLYALPETPKECTEQMSFSIKVLDGSKHLPDAYTGVEYNELILTSDSGCYPSHDIGITKGTLPKGLELKYEEHAVPSQYDTGFWYEFFLTGTPTEMGYYEFTLSFHDGNTTFEREYVFSMYVTDLYSTIQYACVGSEYRETLFTLGEGDTYTISENTILPEGVELKTDNADVILEGTPEEAGDFFVLADVTAKGETSTYMYKLTVHEAKITLVSGFAGEVFRDTLFTYPDCEFEAKDTLPDGLSIVKERAENENICSFVIKGVPEKKAGCEFTVTFKKGDKAILTQKYAVKVEAELPPMFPVYSCAYNVYDETELFFLPNEFEIMNVYGNVPKGLSFEVVQNGYNGYRCMMTGTPEEYMAGRYIFEIEIEKNGYSSRELCVLYVAESQIEIGPLPIYNPLEAMAGTEFDEVKSMELLIKYPNITLEKQDDDYMLKIALPITEEMGYKLPVAVKYTDKDGKAAEAIIQYNVVIVTQLIGDSNLDGKVNTADAVTILKYAADMYKPDNSERPDAGVYFASNADTNKDNVINTADAVQILRYAAGIITVF